MKNEIDFFRNKLLENLSSIQKVSAIEAKMKTLPLASDNNGIGRTELDVKHHFLLGVYARELYIPKDTILVGKIHKYENLNILSKGSMIVLVGDELVKVEAPFTVVSPPGTKRIAYAYEDCIWTTIHGTNLKNVDEIEKQFIAQDENEFLEFCGQLQLRYEP